MAFINQRPLGGYYFDSSSLVMLQTHYQDFNFISNFAYKANIDGSFSPKPYFSRWDEAYPIAVAAGLEKLVLFTDFGDPDPENNTSPILLADPVARNTAVANALLLVEQGRMDGVESDFEVIERHNREDYVTFITDLKAILGPTKIVAVSLPPRLSVNETWLDRFDYQSLAEVADRLHIMFYDQFHGNSPEAGPVAGIDWLQAGLDYLLQYIPKEKLFVKLGAYGRSWGINGLGRPLSLPAIRELIELEGLPVYRDEASGVPYLRWSGADGAERQIWFEDAESLGQKAALARDYDIGGLGVWRMGNIPDDVWQSIVRNWRR